MTIHTSRPNLAESDSQLAPSTAEELADILRDASEQGQQLVPWGAGTLQHLGAPASPDARPLALAGINRVLEYTAADLTIAVEAGATLGAVQAALRANGQWLPWDPPAPAQATIGGLLAAGACGPLRLGYGTPRDWVLGMRVALGDGRLVKSGGKVVKNVAGYDSHKLHIGALGTLGVIAAVTLKVAPLPELVVPLAFICAAHADALALAARLRERPLSPISLVVAGGELAGLPDAPSVLAVRFAGVEAAAERQAQAAIAAAHSAGAEIAHFEAAEHDRLWQALAAFAAPSRDGVTTGPLIIRAGAPLAGLPDVLSALASHAPGGQALLVGDAGVGIAYAHWSLAKDEPHSIEGALARLRAALAARGGYAVVEAAPARLGAQLDRWGAPPPTLALMRGLKSQWDPRGILNRGRYVGEI